MLYFLIKQGVGECRAFPQVFHLTPFLAFTIIFPLFSALMLLFYSTHISLTIHLTFILHLSVVLSLCTAIIYLFCLTICLFPFTPTSSLSLPPSFFLSGAAGSNRLISQENVNPTETREGGDMCSWKDRVIQ